jgi:lysyl-tRNA synthetase class 2
MQAALKTKLEARAKLYHDIRCFFIERGVVEVETPLLCSHTVTDVHIESIATQNRFLQTSPEYCMKRLLAAGSGPIFQICKAFRHEESGSNHNPEFTMLEWYRPGFDHHQLMQELDELIQTLFHSPPAIKQSYRDCFLEHLNIDPLTCDIQIFNNIILQHDLLQSLSGIDRDTALQVILSGLIEPKIGQQQPFFIYDFPASQAALAKIRDDTPPVAERFELYYKGFELANGFHELTNADEQLKRFEADQKKRHTLHLAVPDIDNFFIDALKQGIPNSAGVAVGLDRILMLLTNNSSIQKVLSFDWDHS